MGPLGHPETWCKGIDDLEKRCQEAYAKGARFAKWRNVLQIDPASGLPSDLAIEVCVQNLAQVCVAHPPCAPLTLLGRRVRAPSARFSTRWALFVRWRRVPPTQNPRLMTAHCL